MFIFYEMNNCKRLTFFQMGSACTKPNSKFIPFENDSDEVIISTRNTSWDVWYWLSYHMYLTTLHNVDKIRFMCVLFTLILIIGYFRYYRNFHLSYRGQSYYVLNAYDKSRHLITFEDENQVVKYQQRHSKSLVDQS